MVGKYLAMALPTRCPPASSHLTTNVAGTGGVGGPKIEIEELVSIPADLSAFIPKMGIEL